MIKINNIDEMFINYIYFFNLNTYSSNIEYVLIELEKNSLHKILKQILKELFEKNDLNDEREQKHLELNKNNINYNEEILYSQE